MMRAAMFREPGQPFRIESVSDPSPRADEVVVRIAYCGICGSDVSMTSGTPFDFPLGTVMGHEWAGEVVAIGSAVRSLQRGDRITGMAGVGCGGCEGCRVTGNPVHCSTPSLVMGGFGEYLAVPERAATTLPEGASFGAGALVEPLAVALHAVAMAAIDPKARVLVIGAGAVGLAATYWARRKGIDTIVVCARSTARANLALRMGASAFIALEEHGSEAVADALGGGPEVVLECAGSQGALLLAQSFVAARGTVVSLGMCCREDAMIPAAAAYKETRWLFPIAYSKAEFDYTARELMNGHVDPSVMVDTTISLNDLPDAIQVIRRGSRQLKTHVDPWRQ